MQRGFESELDLINWQEVVLARRVDRRKAATELAERVSDTGSLAAR